MNTVQTAKPFRGIGAFFAMSLDVFVAMFKPPFARQEFLVAVMVYRPGVASTDVDVGDSPSQCWWSSRSTSCWWSSVRPITPVWVPPKGRSTCPPSLQSDARIRTVTQTYEITRTAVGFVVSNPGVSTSKSFTIRVAC